MAEQGPTTGAVTPTSGGLAVSEEPHSGRGAPRRINLYGEDHAMLSAMTISDKLKGWAKRIKRDGLTLWFASKHAGTPWYAKALGVFVVAYAMSPIDLIPDFIPVLGYLDDLILLPVLIWLAIRLLPPRVLADCRFEADAWMQTRGSKPISRTGALLIVALWLAIGAALWFWLVQPRL